jgi:non-ribosomal peptide synthetase component F
MDFKNIKKAAEKQGWAVELNRNGHWKFVPPDPTKDIVYTSGTPSDYRSILNFLARMKRNGLRWPPK